MEPVAIGCPKCNNKIAEAERTMKDKINYVGAVEYSAYHKPLPTVFLDGDPLDIRGIRAVVLGPEGQVLAFHQNPTIPHGNKAHLCGCGSLEFCEVLYRGHVEFRVVPPVVAP